MSVNPSIEAPMLLVLENHKLHISIKGIDYCIENGIIILTLPPYCAYKMQPFDVSIYGLFKNAKYIY